MIRRHMFLLSNGCMRSPFYNVSRLPYKDSLSRIGLEKLHAHPLV